MEQLTTLRATNTFWKASTVSSGMNQYSGPVFKRYALAVAAILFSLTACDDAPSDVEIEKWKAEIVAVEKAFNDMAQQEGLVKAFEHYAAADGVIRRGKKVVKGKAAIAAWYENDVKPNETLTWVPTFVDVSQSGDLAYTYGDYIFTYPDTLGNNKENKGVFHTVWKRQSDGNWRFVWD